MILAAGEGTRLRPLTNDRPKPMIRIGGTPILEHNLRLLVAAGVRQVAINLHHRPEVISEYFGDGSRFGVEITYSHEERLLGTAGAVKKMATFFDSDFFLVYGDNLSTIDLRALAHQHDAKKSVLTMAVIEREDPAESGIVELDKDDRIVRFVEKPAPGNVFSRFVNAGYLVVSAPVLSMIPDDTPSDFGRDVFVRLVGSGALVYAYRMSEGLWWIDSPSDHERTRRTFAR